MNCNPKKFSKASLTNSFDLHFKFPPQVVKGSDRLDR